jgi:hypothetical protein
MYKKKDKVIIIDSCSDFYGYVFRIKKVFYDPIDLDLTIYQLDHGITLTEHSLIGLNDRVSIERQGDFWTTEYSKFVGRTGYVSEILGAPHSLPVLVCEVFIKGNEFATSDFPLGWHKKIR